MAATAVFYCPKFGVFARVCKKDPIPHTCAFMAGWVGASSDAPVAFVLVRQSYSTCHPMKLAFPRVAVIPTKETVMSDLAVFSFHEAHDVRVIIENGEPLFHANDLCAVLEYTNPRDALRRHVETYDVVKRDTIDRMGRTQSSNFVVEGGMWSLILGSHTAKSKDVKKWVTSEVLPTIRKTGSYSLPKPVEKRDYMTNSDMLNIKRLIYSLTNGMAYKTSCSQAIWHALRQVTGVPSPAKFEVQHIPVVAHELQRIYGALQAYIEVRREVEQELIKRIVRNQEDAQSVLPVLFGLISATISEERSDVGKQWHRLFGHECQNLLNRVPNDYDHHQFNEQRLI